MKQKAKWPVILGVIIIAVILTAVIAFFYINSMDWGFAREVPQQEKELRTATIDCAVKWLGVNSVDGSHKEIIDIYNAHTPLAQNYTVKYTDKWCATFISTVAIQCRLTRIIPTECGCQRQIELFKNLGNWEENDDYIPLPGDIIYYSDKGSTSNDNTGWSEHVGIVVGTNGNYIKVMEGNVAGVASFRYIPIGDATIRGYGLPDYASACSD